jgi:glycosyltransferase involved in cell wall biosynthesis
MHILIIPFGHYVTPKAPISAVFQYHLAHALKNESTTVGVVSAGFVPFRKQFSSYPYSPFENDNGVNTYRRYKRMLIPGRLANKFFLRYLIGMYLDLFKRYVDKQGMPDIVHAHNSIYAGVAAFKIKEKYNIPYLITEHSTAYAQGLISNQQSKLIKQVLKNAEIKTVVSTKLGSLLENLFGADACPYYPIFNILDNRFEKEKFIVKNIKKAKDVFTFLNIASLDAKKNQSDLIEAFASTFKGNNNVQLRIGGHGPLRGQLEAKTKKLGIANQVVFTGLLSREKVFFEMQNCDVFVLSSTFETFGVVLIEALACGKPVVATECGGPEDIVNKNNGVLVPIKKVDMLAEAMFNIYSNIHKYDQNIIRQDCLKRFGKDSFVARLKSIYSGILEKRKA